MDVTESFMGVDAERVTALGRIAVAGSRLESVAHDVAWSMHVDPRELQFAPLRRAVRDKLSTGWMPQYARVSADEVRRWLDAALTAFQQRNEVLHSVEIRVARDGEWVRRSHRLKTAEVRELDLAKLEKVATLLKRAVGAGTNLECELLPEPRPGVYVRRPRPGHSAFIAIKGAAAGYTERPSDSELDAWWSTYAPSWGPVEEWYPGHGAPSLQAVSAPGRTLRHDMSDPYNLTRFVEAQDAGGTYDAALAELRAGRKRSHWMWFVFPQVAGLGRSPAAQRFAIAGLDEAKAYVDHPVLGPRLIAAAHAVLTHASALQATDILGGIDAIKLRSSMTLFARAAPQEPVFADVLAAFYDGDEDPETVRRL